MPAKGAGARPRDDGPAFRRPPPDLVAAAARRLLARGPASFPSQAAFRRALLRELRRRDRRFALGAGRLRRLLLAAGAVRLAVRYAERPTRRPLTRCPVCGSALRPIRNRTLDGDRVTLGYRCPRCAYWTHLARRVPTRYAVRAGPATGPRSG